MEAVKLAQEALNSNAEEKQKLVRISAEATVEVTQ
jgi:hypothetical protein